MKKKSIKVLMAAMGIATVVLAGCGDNNTTSDSSKVSNTESNEQVANDDTQSSEVSVKEENDETNEAVSVSENPLCNFAFVHGFDGVDSKDISAIEIFGGELTIGDLASAKEIISKCSNLEIRNYADNAVLTTSDPEEVLNYTGELGNNMDNDELLRVGGDETILCVFNGGKVRIRLYNNTDSDITLKDAISDNKYYIELEGNALTGLTGDSTEDLMASLVNTLGAPDSILATDKDINNLSEPMKDGYNKFTSLFVYKTGDFNLVIKSYEVLQGKDDVKSELTLKYETFYSEGLQLNGKSFVDYEFNKDGYKEF